MVLRPRERTVRPQKFVTQFNRLRSVLEDRLRPWGRSECSSIADPSVIAWAPRAPRVTIIVVVVVGAAKSAEAAPEMTAMKTMAAAKTTTVAAAEAVTAATAADQDQWAAYSTQWRLSLRATEIARLCECGSGGNSKRKSAKKTRRHQTERHDCTPFVGVWASKPLIECVAPPLNRPVSTRRVRRPLSSLSNRELVVPTPRCKGASCGMIYESAFNFA